jgi:hypothetical protein
LCRRRQGRHQAAGHRQEREIPRAFQPSTSCFTCNDGGLVTSRRTRGQACERGLGSRSAHPGDNSIHWPSRQRQDLCEPASDFGVRACRGGVPAGGRGAGGDPVSPARGRAPVSRRGWPRRPWRRRARLGCRSPAAPPGSRCRDRANPPDGRSLPSAAPGGAGRFGSGTWRIFSGLPCIRPGFHMKMQRQ